MPMSRLLAIFSCAYAWTLACASLRAPFAAAARVDPSRQNAVASGGAVVGGAARQGGAGERSDQGELLLFDLAKHPYARCLDGSPAGYYISHGSNDLVVINLQGGGECVDKAGCQGRAQSDLGSSSKWASKAALFNRGAFNVNATRNPRFAEATFVFVPYCTGDLFYGTRREASDASFGLYFSGAHIIDALAAELSALDEVQNARLVVYGGESAGGLGALATLDRFGSALGSEAEVVGTPIGGYYFLNDAVYTGSDAQEYIPWGSSSDAWPHYYDLWQSYVPRRCAAAMGASEAWRCQVADFSFKYVSEEYRIFVSEALTDAVVTTLHDGVPNSAAPPFTSEQRAYLETWALTMSKSLIANAEAAPSAGVFAPACWTHTTFDGIELQGREHLAALSAWALDKQAVKLVDGCGALVACNPTCDRKHAV